MPNADDTQRFTIILVPDGTSRVRRLHFPRLLMRRAAWGAGILAALLLAGTADYVRLRWNAIDVDRLRAETAAQQQEIERFTSDMGELQQRLTRLRELERKVRIIANLPKTAAEEGQEQDAHPQGRGGGREDESSERPPGGDVAAADEAAASLAVLGRDVDSELPDYWPRPDAVARIRTRAHTFQTLALSQEASLEDLIEGLDGKSRQLASTPSIWPARGWITSRFGRRISPFTGRPHFHAGIDVAAAFGTEVVSPGRGRVVFVGRKGALGRSVVIDHGYGIRTTFGHLAAAHVRKGDEVERGQRVGTVGSTGRSTGPHLHYAVAIRGKAVDPIDYIFE